MNAALPEFEYYPARRDVDAWLDGILSAGVHTPCNVVKLNDGFSERFWMGHAKGFCYLRFEPEDREPFHGYWQPAPFGPAPLLVHTPGGGAEIVVHPDLAMQGFSVMHVNPLGYMTPDGINGTLMPDRKLPPVIPATIRSGAADGYRQWLTDCSIAVEWARRQPAALPDRVSFFGTSQGGFGSLLLGSLYKDHGARCVAAEEPFGVNFPLGRRLGVSAAYQIVFDAIESMEDPTRGWYGAGMVDSLSHAARLTMPVLLAAGGADILCPHQAIKTLFERLPGNKMFFYMDGQGHDPSPQFVTLAAAWFRMYA